jgi:hypothetical protein
VQQHGRRPYRQRARLDPRQDLHPRQFLRTHRCPSQSATFSEIANLGGHFYFARRGHYYFATTAAVQCLGSRVRPRERWLIEPFNLKASKRARAQVVPRPFG